MLIATAMKKIKPVVTKKHHLDERVETLFNKFLEYLEYQDFHSKINIIGFQTNLSFTGVGCFIETLLEENSLEVKVEGVIEVRQISKKM